jgi:hypothetical protein
MSSTPLPTGTDFSIAAIVHTIYRTVVQKSYFGCTNADPGTSAGLALQLHKLRQRSRGHVVDWQAQLLVPFIAEFRVIRDIGVSKADEEYILLLSTVFVLAYELLMLQEIACQDSTMDFLDSKFDQTFCEPEICRSMILRLEAEQHRLHAACTDVSVLKAVGALCRLMPGVTASTALWEKMRRAVCPRRPESIIAAQTRLTTFLRDVQIHVFLKPKCTMEFDFVTSIRPCDAHLIVNTCIGVSMHVQPNFAISALSGMFDTVTLSRPLEEFPEKMFAATIIVPPGYSYRITDVHWTSEMQNGSAQTAIETDWAVVNVGGGDHAIRCKDAHRSLLVVNHE